MTLYVYPIFHGNRIYFFTQKSSRKYRKKEEKKKNYMSTRYFTVTGSIFLHKNHLGNIEKKKKKRRIHFFLKTDADLLRQIGKRHYT